MKQKTEHNKRIIPELLAPAGGKTQLIAAVNNGADAVYLGGSRFNARGKAENFTMASLRDAIDYAHERDVKIYVTFNTLLRDSELADALEYAGCLWDIGADAVIVQDLGLVRMLRRYLPQLPLHMSTQGTVCSRWGVDLMKELGIRRIVPARELSLEEIRQMTEVCHGTAPTSAGTGRVKNSSDWPSCEVEVFVHGALCMCYSGQCQMSRLLGGTDEKGSARSGNRGLCAQPCRLPYTDDQGRTAYFLSPKDLCLLEEIPALCGAGVDSLKIEGRLKSPEYVAVVTGIYRKYLDQFARTGKISVAEDDKRALTQIFNRGGFTTGYLYGNPGEGILSGQSPKNTGVFIGEVRTEVREKNAGKDRAAAAGARRKGAALIDAALIEPLSEGDGVEIRPPAKAGRRAGKGADRTGYGGKDAGGVVTFLRHLPGGLTRIGDMKGSFRSGDGIWKVTDRALLSQARETFAGENAEQTDREMRYPRALKMTFEAAVGQPAMLTMASGAHRVKAYSEGPMEEARQRAVQPEQISRQLRRLGGTPFAASEEDVRIMLDGQCAIPAAQINALRREGIGMLLQKKRETDRIPTDTDALAEAMEEVSRGRLQLPEKQLPEPVPLMEFMDGAEGLPYIDAVSKGRLDTYIEERFDAIADRLRQKDSGILIRGNGWIRQFLDAGVKVFAGHGLNVYNEQARLALEEIGAEVIEVSHEAGSPSDETIPLMVTEHPVKSKTLTDRKGRVHMVERSAAGDKTIIR